MSRAGALAAERPGIAVRAGHPGPQVEREALAGEMHEIGEGWRVRRAWRAGRGRTKVIMGTTSLRDARG